MSEYLLNCLRLGTAFNKTHKTFDGDRRIAPTFRSLLVGERDTIKQIRYNKTNNTNYPTKKLPEQPEKLTSATIPLLDNA